MDFCFSLHLVYHCRPYISLILWQHGSETGIKLCYVVLNSLRLNLVNPGEALFSLSMNLMIISY